jgi:hypothetical protein
MMIRPLPLILEGKKKVIISSAVNHIGIHYLKHKGSIYVIPCYAGEPCVLCDTIDILCKTGGVEETKLMQYHRKKKIQCVVYWEGEHWLFSMASKTCADVKFGVGVEIEIDRSIVAQYPHYEIKNTGETFTVEEQEPFIKRLWEDKQMKEAQSDLLDIFGYNKTLLRRHKLEMI